VKKDKTTLNKMRVAAKECDAKGVNEELELRASLLQGKSFRRYRSKRVRAYRITH
jgi:hypothetical protein